MLPGFDLPVATQESAVQHPVPGVVRVGDGSRSNYIGLERVIDISVILIERCQGRNGRILLRLRLAQRSQAKRKERQ